MKIKTYLILADIHYPKVNKPALNAALDFLSKNKVDGIVLQGDQLDFEGISHHTKNKPLYRLRNSFMKDIEGFERDVLLPIEARLKKDAERYWLDGNHERFAYDLIEEQPELEGAVDYKKFLKLTQRGYGIIELGHCLKLGKLNIVHGEILSGLGNQGSMFPARKAVELYGGNVLAAHSHAPQLFTKVSPVEHTQKHQGYINGILGDTNPSYLRNRPTAFSHGLAVLEIRSDRNFNLYLVNIYNGVFSYGGTIYGAD